MNIVRCPRCLDDVTVPIRASPKALVRCPLCLEEYLLREALGGLPPELVVLDGSDQREEPALVGAAAGLDEIEQAALGGGEYQLSGGSYAAALDATAPGGAMAAPRPAVKGTRQKRREKNGFVELVKIVLGGVLGLTLGYFVLLWGLSMDVLSLGPKIAPYAPWIVPAKFHGQATDSSTAAANGNSNLDTSGDSSPAGTGSRNGQGKSVPPGVMVPIGGVAQSSATDTATGTVDPDTGAGLGGGYFTEPAAQPIPLPEPDLGPLLPEVNPKPATPAEVPQTSTDSTTTPPEPPTTKANTKTKPEPSTATEPAPGTAPSTIPETNPLPTAEDLTKAVLATSEATTKVNEATGQLAEVRRQLFIDFYGAASDAGRVLSQLDAADPDLAEQVATLKTALASLAMQPGKVSALKSLTDINLPERKHEQGVLVAGVAGQFSPAGEFHAATFQAGKSGTETVVVSASDPTEAFSTGDELLLVGRVIEDPAKNLPGYEGKAARVVLLGVAVLVPKAE